MVFGGFLVAALGEVDERISDAREFFHRVTPPTIEQHELPRGVQRHSVMLVKLLQRNSPVVVRVIKEPPTRERAEALGDGRSAIVRISVKAATESKVDVDAREGEALLLEFSVVLMALQISAQELEEGRLRENGLG